MNMNLSALPPASQFLLPAALVLALGTVAHAADFSAGSNGSYGTIDITANTILDVPVDGVFHCTTITIASQATLQFNPNPLNTPIYLLATGDVLIAGTISLVGADFSGAIPGRGGPGGFGGGFGGMGSNPPLNRGGDGHGPGRGVNTSGWWAAAYSTAASANTNVYGNVLIVPLIGGSGGAGSTGNPGYGGGGGGGAILIASHTGITVNGTINAAGGYSHAGSGSGGAIRLVAPTGGGNGRLHVNGGGGASQGRIRVDCTTVEAFRNLYFDGPVTRGTRMFVFPPTSPALHIIHAAGQDIPVGTGAAVTVELPAGSPLSQTIRLRGEGFSGTVPVTLVVNPEHSASSTYDLSLNGSANPPEVSVSVHLPVGEATRIEAWAH